MSRLCADPAIMKAAGKSVTPYPYVSLNLVYRGETEPKLYGTARELLRAGFARLPGPGSGVNTGYRASTFLEGR